MDLMSINHPWFLISSFPPSWRLTRFVKLSIVATKSYLRRLNGICTCCIDTEDFIVNRSVLVELMKNIVALLIAKSILNAETKVTVNTSMEFCVCFFDSKDWECIVAPFVYIKAYSGIEVSTLNCTLEEMTIVDIVNSFPNWFHSNLFCVLSWIEELISCALFAILCNNDDLILLSSQSKPKISRPDLNRDSVCEIMWGM